jgi:hypothetical protein
MKLIIIAKCDVCGKAAFSETTSQAVESSSISYFFKNELDLYCDGNDQYMCAVCRNKWKELIKKQEEDRKNFN